MTIYEEIDFLLSTYLELADMQQTEKMRVLLTGMVNELMVNELMVGKE